MTHPNTCCQELVLKEAVCVDLGDGCNTPAFRVLTKLKDQETESFITDAGDVTAQVVGWKAGNCPNNRLAVDTCFLPDQYAIVWAWNGSGDVMSYDPTTGVWTDYGTVMDGDGNTVGGYSMDIRNDAVNPEIIYQRSGCVYKAPLDNPTQATLIGCSTNPSFSGSYPCGAFTPDGNYIIGIGSGSTVGEVDLTTGEVTTLCQLTDSRDGALLSAGPGDWFFDPNGQLFLMARDIRGATFGTTTGTILWEIDLGTCIATPVGNTPSPTSGTGASWLSGGQYLLSSGSNIYTYFPGNDNAPGSPDAWQQQIPNAPHSINDLGNQWIIPEPIRVFGFVEKGCPDPLSCEHCLYTLKQDPSTFEIACEPFEIQLPGQFGKCETDPNPYVSDPFSPSSSDNQAKNPDQVWNEGCSPGQGGVGVVLWRAGCDSAGNLFTEYLYGSLEEPTTVPPPNFSSLPCGSGNRQSETTTWCDLDQNKTVYRKEFNLTGVVVWFDDTGNIPEPLNKEPGACDFDPLLPITEEVVCYEDEVYIRRYSETYIENTEGLPELVSYQVLYYNENGTLWDSGIVPAGDPLPAGEPTGWYFGDCVSPYIDFRVEKLCEVDDEKLLLVDSGGGFAEYSFTDGSLTDINTLSVPSAGSGADPDNFLLYAITSGSTLQTVDVNTKQLISETTLFTNDSSPLSFSAAHFYDGWLYVADSAGGAWSIYRVNVNTAEVSFYNGGWSGVLGSGTSLAINPVDGKFYITGSLGRVYEIGSGAGDSGTATLVYDSLGNIANGATFDTNGNLYLTGGPNTYQIQNLGSGGEIETQIIDDWTPAANSITFYRTTAQTPSCFYRRYGVLEDGTWEYLSDHFVADFSPRVVSGAVDCCECSCGGEGGGAGSTVVANFPEVQSIDKEEICADGKTYWRVCAVQNDGSVLVTFEDETGVVSEPANWTVGACECTSVGRLWKISDDAAVGTNVDWWAPTTFPAGSNAAPHGNVSEIFTSDESTLQHVNGAPDVSFVSPEFAVMGTSTAQFQSDVGAASNAETGGTDQLRLSGYIVLKEPAVLRDVNGNTGERGGIWINRCCQETLKLFQERTTDTAGADTGVFDGVRLPAGIHYIEAATSDFSAWQGLELSVSFDDGATFEPFTSFTTKPTYECIPVNVCNGELQHAVTGDPVIVEKFDSWCEPKGCDGSSVSVNEKEYVTGFDTEILNSAFTVPTFPANTKEVVIFNDSGAVITIDTSIGPQTVMQGGTIEFSVFDYETALTASAMTIVSGTFNASDRIVFNYKTIS